MPTQFTRVNEKRSKTVNLSTNLMKVGKRRRLDFGYTLGQGFPNWGA